MWMQAWPGKYKYDYNPFSGTIYNNMFLTFDIEQGSSRNKRQVSLSPVAAEPAGINSKGFKDFNLQAKARIWP